MNIKGDGLNNVLTNLGFREIRYGIYCSLKVAWHS